MAEQFALIKHQTMVLEEAAAAEVEAARVLEVVVAMEAKCLMVGNRTKDIR